MRTMLGACLLAVAFIVPASAQDASKKGSDADEAFMTGIRKIGVMTGQAFACTATADQPKVGEAVMDTNACRLFCLSVAQAMDNATENNTRVLAPGGFARADFLHWAWQIKFEAAKNVAHVVDKMLHACGGSGYKRDMELERYLRDAKAGWVMGPTNEVLRQFVGKAVLLGFDSLDYWNQSYNRRAVENELKKLDAKGKRELGEQLLAEAEEQAAKEPAKAAT